MPAGTAGRGQRPPSRAPPAPAPPAYSPQRATDRAWAPQLPGQRREVSSPGLGPAWGPRLSALPRRFLPRAHGQRGPSSDASSGPPRPCPCPRAVPVSSLGCFPPPAQALEAAGIRKVGSRLFLAPPVRARASFPSSRSPGL